jgi:hypothetical protein
MEKTTVYLPSGLKRRLAHTAHRRGQSEAEVIRAALEQALDPAPRPRPVLPLVHGDDPTVSQRVDELLEGFGE